MKLIIEIIEKVSKIIYMYVFKIYFDVFFLFSVIQYLNKLIINLLKKGVLLFKCVGI